MTFFDDEPDAVTESRRRREEERGTRRVRMPRPAGATPGGPGDGDGGDGGDDGPRRPRPRRPRGGGRPDLSTAFGSGPARLLVVGLLALVLLLIVVFSLRSCARDREVNRYKDYVAAANEIGVKSAGLGAELVATFRAIKPNANRDEIARSIEVIRTKQGQFVDQAKALDPPGQLAGPNALLVLSMELRQLGLTGLRDDVVRAFATDNPQVAAGQLAGDTNRLVASDVLYNDSFRNPTFAILTDKKITDVTLAENVQFLSDPSLVGVSGLTGTITTAKKEAANLSGPRGTALIAVKAVPSGSELLPGGGANTVTLTPDLAFQVQIQNQGANAEPEITAEITVRGGGDTDGQKVTGTATNVAKGQTATITVPFDPQPPLPFGAPVELVIRSVELPKEKVTENNTKTYTVTFARG